MTNKKGPSGAKIKKLTTRKLNVARETLRDLTARDPAKIKGGNNPQHITGS